MVTLALTGSRPYFIYDDACKPVVGKNCRASLSSAYILIDFEYYRRLGEQLQICLGLRLGRRIVSIHVDL